jgi:hypothetical protein
VTSSPSGVDRDPGQPPADLLHQPRASASSGTWRSSRRIALPRPTRDTARTWWTPLPPDGCGATKWNEHARDPLLIAKTAGPKVYRVPTVFHHPGQVLSLQEMVVDSHPAKPPPNSATMHAGGRLDPRKDPPSPQERRKLTTHILPTTTCPEQRVWSHPVSGFPDFYASIATAGALRQLPPAPTAAATTNPRSDDPGPVLALHSNVKTQLLPH